MVGQLFNESAHLIEAILGVLDAGVAADHVVEIELGDVKQRARPLEGITIGEEGSEAVQQIAGRDHFLLRAEHNYVASGVASAAKREMQVMGAIMNDQVALERDVGQFRG